MSKGSADRAGDVDPPEAGRGRHHLPDAATAAASGHPADAHPKHGQHFQFHDGNPAHLCRGSPESGQWGFTLKAALLANLSLHWYQCYAACEYKLISPLYCSGSLITCFFSLFS